MLPPLLGLLLDCAKKTDQNVVSISLGALVHLIEVGGHQFSDNDWDTLLRSIRYYLEVSKIYIWLYSEACTHNYPSTRDAAYTTQPLELLNSLGFENSKHQNLVKMGSDTIRADTSSFQVDHYDSNGGQRLSNEQTFDSGTSGKDPSTVNSVDNHKDIKLQNNLEEAEGMPLLTHC